MNWILASIFFISLSTILAKENVIILTDETFEETIKNNSITMVEFYAPWCGHCKSFAPKYERLATEIKGKSMPYVIAKLDATANSKTANSQGVQGYPTIKLYLDGKAIDYGGQRTVEAILEFIAKKTSPFSTMLKTVEEIKEKLNGDKLRSILVGIDNDTLNLYTRVGQRVESYEYYNANLSLMVQIFPYIKHGNVLLVKNFDEGQVIYSEPISESTLEDFLKMHKDPIVASANQDITKDVFNTGKRVGIILIREDSYEDLNRIESEFQKAALALRSRDFIFAKTDIKEGWGERAANFLGIEKCSKPVIVIVLKKEDISTYRYEGTMVADEIKKFIEKFKRGELVRYFKSEEVPIENTGPVYKVVSKTFKKEVLENDEDVIVKFYATWCGQCKKLVPVFKALAESFKDNKKLKFVEIDATKNEIEGHSIKFYPVIKFFPGKNKANVQEYSGDRSEDDIKRFIIKKTSYPELFNEKKPDL